SNKLVIQAANLAQQLFALARSGRDIVHHLIEAAGNFSYFIISMDSDPRGEISPASMGHRLDDVFHRPAEEIDKEQVQQEHRSDHRANKHEVVLAMKTGDQPTMITLEHERLDKAAMLAVAQRRCNPLVR